MCIVYNNYNETGVLNNVIKWFLYPSRAIPVIAFPWVPIYIMFVSLTRVCIEYALYT